MSDSTAGELKHYKATMIDNSYLEWDGGSPCIDEIILSGAEWAVIHGINNTVILHLSQIKFVEVT